MPKQYKIEKKLSIILSLFSLVMFAVILIPIFTNPDLAILNSNGSYKGSILLIVAIIVFGGISAYPFISAATSFLELNNGMLVRKHLGMRVWELPVSAIIDIYRGNTVNYTRGGSGPMEIGLTFRKRINEKYFWYRQVPYDIENESQLISELQALNPNIQFHYDPGDLREVYHPVISIGV